MKNKELCSFEKKYGSLINRIETLVNWKQKTLLNINLHKYLNLKRGFFNYDEWISMRALIIFSVYKCSSTSDKSISYQQQIIRQVIQMYFNLQVCKNSHHEISRHLTFFINISRRRYGAIHNFWQPRVFQKIRNFVKSNIVSKPRLLCFIVYRFNQAMMTNFSGSNPFFSPHHISASRFNILTYF